MLNKYIVWLEDGLVAELVRAKTTQNAAHNFAKRLRAQGYTGRLKVSARKADDEKIKYIFISEE